MAIHIRVTNKESGNSFTGALTTANIIGIKKATSLSTESILRSLQRGREINAGVYLYEPVLANKK